MSAPHARIARTGAPWELAKSPMEQRVSRGDDDLFRLLCRLRHGSDVAHLPTWLGVLLSIKMQLHALIAVQRCLPVWFSVLPEITEKIRHRGWTQQHWIAEWESAHCA